MKEDFNSVFEGIRETREDIKEELDLLKSINAEQKKELRKAQVFNVIMLLFAVVSLIIAIIEFAK